MSEVVPIEQMTAVVDKIQKWADRERAVAEAAGSRNEGQIRDRWRARADAFEMAADSLNDAINHHKYPEHLNHVKAQHIIDDLAASIQMVLAVRYDIRDSVWESMGPADAPEEARFLMFLHTSLVNARRAL